MPFDVDIDGPARPFFEAGRDYFYTRRGQMNLACHHCHELNAGRFLRGDRLSQGQPTGYPIYRLDWQTVGSLHRRLRFCNTGVRAEPFAFGDARYINLELFLAWRARGLPSEAPAVRR
jgi:sulfur-oxidizing protein SoxA